MAFPMVNRPFFKSYLYCSSDPGAIPDALMRGFNVVVLVDVEETPNYPACFPMSSLLPPFQLVHMILETDRNDPKFEQISQMYFGSYYAYLASPDKESNIVNLLASMYKTTKHTLLFTEYDVENQFHPLGVLKQFFLQQFGINIIPYEHLYVYNDQQQPVFTLAPEFVYKVIDLLFTNHYITREEYAVMLPPGSVPSPRSIQILLSDYNCIFPTMEASITAACNIIDAYRHQAQTGKFCPAIQLTQELDNARNQQIQQLVSNSKTRFGRYTMNQIQTPNFVGQQAIAAPK